MMFAKFSQAVLLFVALVAIIATRPAHAQKETILYNFTDLDGDGDTPQAQLISDGQGNFYGTTSFGGDSGRGTVFVLAPNGNGGWSETVIYTFTGGADGGGPYGPVLFDAAGNLYGTAQLGGAFDKGVVFELRRSGITWTQTVLYSFGVGRDGQSPFNNLLMDGTGHLYGTTLHEVFQLTSSGSGWTETTIYYPVDDILSGLTMDPAGNIYGASLSRVFELSPNGKGGWRKRAIHIFTGGPNDGDYARGTPVLDSTGNLYGTTASGGLGGDPGYGTIYELSPGTNGAWIEKILYFFKGGKDANNPSMGGMVLDAGGNLYGTSYNGGIHNKGTVFKLVAPTGKGSYKEKLLWNFNGINGNFPNGGLILDNTGDLYGTALGGNPNYCSVYPGCGVVFKITP